jgi:hypothetical protein
MGKFSFFPVILQGRSCCFVDLIIKLTAYAADGKAVIRAHLQVSAHGLKINNNSSAN